MRPILITFAALLWATGFLPARGKAFVEQSPNRFSVAYQNPVDAPWDLQFSFEIYSIDPGVAGAEYDGTYFYAAKWTSNLLYRLDLSGNLVEEFSIPGVSGLRDLAFDGTYMYGGTAGNTIYQMDFNTKTLIATILSPVSVRQIAYDEAHDAFWVGNWDTDIKLINRNGSSLLTISQPVHGLNSMYGSAYDKWTPGGPYLGVFDQGQGVGFSQLIHQIDLNTLAPTGMTYDVTADFPVSPALAAGLWTTADFVPGTTSIGGILQSYPDILFVYELAPSGDPNDPNPPANVAAYSDFTTPTSMLITWTDPTTLVNGDPITPFTIQIERDGTPLASVASGAGTYTDTALNDGQLYTYEVYTKLISNDSTSAPVTVFWHAGGHPVPVAPDNLQAVGSLSDATLTWDDPTTQADGTPLDDLDHINIYRDGSLVGSVSPGTETYTDVPPVAGFYDYTVTAVDNETPPNESDPSNEAGTFVGQTPDYLVWVHPDVVAGSAASGDSLFEALLANGQSVYLTNNLFEFGTDLSIYQGVFVVLGIFPNNGVLLVFTPEALALESYVTGGGNLYLEGGDCFYYDPQFSGLNINPWFDCVPLADGSDDVFNLQGLNELSAFGFAYGGENNWMDELSSGGQSSEIWQETATLSIHGLYYDGFGGAAIGVVPSFGGMVSSPGSMVSSQKRTYDGMVNQQPQAGSYLEMGTALKARPERAAEKRFRKRGAYKPELTSRIDRSKPLYKITPKGIEFLANSQVDLMAAYLALMNPAPELMYYKFNEVGATATQNFAAASTPVPATASVNGGLTMGGSGYQGAALIGSGGSSATDYVDTGWPTNLSGSWTIAFWLNDLPNNSNLYYLWGDNTTTAGFRCFLGGAAGAGNLLARGPIPDVLITGVAPGPSEVVLVYDEALLELRAYVNGVLNNTVAAPAPVVITGTSPFRIGGYGFSIGLPANSLMDEFKMFTRAIDVEQNSRDYAVPEFVDFPISFFVNIPYIIKGLVVNEGSDPQTDVPVRFFVDGEQVGSDVLVSLASGDSAVVSYPWTPTIPGYDTLKIQSFLAGDQNPSNDSVSTIVAIYPGIGPNPPPYPDHFEVTLTPPQTLTETLTIFNTAGIDPLDFYISIEGVQGANNRVDILANEQTRRAPVISRGREIPVEEYLERVGAGGRSVSPAGGSQKPEHPEDLVEPYDRIMPGRTPGGQIPQGQDHKGLKKISTIGFNASPDGEEIFGSIQNVFGPAGARGRGNHFFCNTATTLTEHRFYLNMTANTDIQFLVYEGDAQVGDYTLINISEIAFSGTGEGWYSSGPIDVPLVVGKYYLIYPQWNAVANYYNEQNIVPYPIPASFGELQMGVGWNWAPAYNNPPSATQNVPASAFGDPVAYYQTIITGGTSWLSVDPTSGTIPPGESMDVQVTFDAEGLAAGDYYANIVVEYNDPFNLSDTVSVHLLVAEDVFIRVHPNPVEFGQVFINSSMDESMWVVNDGNDSLIVSNIIISDPQFSVYMTSFEVPPFDSVEVTVIFAPTVLGTISGSMTIVNNSNNAPNKNVDLTGEGVLSPPIVWPSPIFEQLSFGDSLDVDVIIHNMGSSNLHWSATLSLTPVQAELTPFMGPAGDRKEAKHHSRSRGPAISLVPEAPWDLQFAYDLSAITGGSGNAGAEYDGGNSLYSTRWGSNLLHEIDLSGNLVREFSVTGVTGLRDLAYDGTFFYGGAAANTVYQMDFSTTPGTLIGTIPSPVPVRHIAYDEGADGFWVGDWDTPPTLIDRSGATLQTLMTGLQAQFGSAYDSYTIGGPYLWVWDQGSGAGFPQLIHQFHLSTGMPTGVTYDVASDFPGNPGIAGGVWISEGVVTGVASIGGVFQGTPDISFAYELSAGNPPWMHFVGPNSGVIPPDSSGGPTIRLHALVADTVFEGAVIFHTNDPVLPIYIVPVTLEVDPLSINDWELLPTSFAVSPNYPNPFNPGTAINYQLPRAADVKLVIFNILGQKVRTLVDGRRPPGYHQATWDARNDTGELVGSGLYIYRFQAADYSKIQKMILLK